MENDAGPPYNAWVNIAVPGGSSHDLDSGINAPHILQTVGVADFEVEIKFESPVTEQYHMQGILVKDDAGPYLRF